MKKDKKIAQPLLALIRNPKIPHGVFRLFLLLDSYSEGKYLFNLPAVFVPQQMLAEDMGVHRNSVSNWIKILEAESCVIVYRGAGRTNIYQLKGGKKRE